MGASFSRLLLEEAILHGVASAWLVLQTNPCIGPRTRRSSTKLEFIECDVYCSHQSSKMSCFAIISGVIALGCSRFLCLLILACSNSSTRNLKFRDSQCRLSRGLDHIVHFQPLKGDLCTHLHISRPDREPASSKCMAS